MADSDSRTLMLVGAINAFREHGIATTSLTEIVERSGAPRGSVYHYFPEGKGQLAGEAVAYFGRGVSAAISSMIAQSSPPEIIDAVRSEEHTSELPSLMRISYAVFCLKKTTTQKT